MVSADIPTPDSLAERLEAIEQKPLDEHANAYETVIQELSAVLDHDVTVPNDQPARQ